MKRKKRLYNSNYGRNIELQRKDAQIPCEIWVHRAKASKSF